VKDFSVLPQSMLILFFRGFDALTTSLRLAPPSAAVGALIHDLSEFKVLPRALTSLTKNSAIAKLLTERLTTKPRNNGNINARLLLGFHKKDKPKDDLLLEYG
jgi:hypothetical protein